MNEDTRQRLVNFSEAPPASAWQAIANRLDKPAYAQRLYDFETPPPATIWQAIEKTLTTPAPVVSLRRKLFQKAIAAAALLAFATTGILYLQHQTSKYAAGGMQHATGNPKTETPSGKATNALQNNTEENKTALKTDKDEVAGTIATVSRQALVQFSRRVRISKNSLLASTINITPEDKNNIAPELPDRYMIATTQSGKAVRLPKKAYSDYACADRFQNYLCKEKLATIQSKMAASVATDFTDFMDLLKNLQEGQ